MSKTGLVAFEEIRRNAFKKSFILVLFSVPFFIVMMVVPGIIMEQLSKNDLPIGYVDLSGILENARPLPVRETGRNFDILAFPDQASARSALDDGQIQALFVLQPDYSESRLTELVYHEEPDGEATRAFYDFLQLNLLTQLPEQVAWRAADRTSVTIQDPDGARRFPSGGPTLGSVLPIFFGMAVGGLLLLGAGTLMTGLVDEKSNRTMEVLATSVSPSRMVTGKLLGILSLSFVQLAFWIVIGVVVIWVAGSVFEVTWFQDPQVDWFPLLAVAAVALPSYVFASATLFALGATVVDAQEGQSLGPLLFMAMFIPVYLLIAIANEPHGAVAVALSMLPLTSILAIGIRSMLTVVPAWQVLASMVIQLFFAIAAIWLAGKAFRMGMLRYGQRLRFRELLGRSQNRARV